MLVHDDGVIVPELDKIYKTQVAHDPHDLDAARRIADAHRPHPPRRPLPRPVAAALRGDPPRRAADRGRAHHPHRTRSSIAMPSDPRVTAGRSRRWRGRSPSSARCSRARSRRPRPSSSAGRRRAASGRRAPASSWATSPPAGSTPARFAALFPAVPPRRAGGDRRAAPRRRHAARHPRPRRRAVPGRPARRAAGSAPPWATRSPRSGARFGAVILADAGARRALPGRRARPPARRRSSSARGTRPSAASRRRSSCPSMAPTSTPARSPTSPTGAQKIVLVVRGAVPAGAARALHHAGHVRAADRRRHRPRPRRRLRRTGRRGASSPRAPRVFFHDPSAGREPWQRLTVRTAGELPKQAIGGISALADDRGPHAARAISRAPPSRSRPMAALRPPRSGADDAVDRIASWLLGAVRAAGQRLTGDDAAR